LVCLTEIVVRFSEVDSMGVVWHGNYIKYLEDGREAFGARYGLGYLDFHRNGVMVPLVKISCDYKKPLKYGDSAIVETKFINCESAKLQFDYIIYNKSNRDIISTATSVQVFIDRNMELLLDIPAFVREWKKKNGLI